MQYLTTENFRLALDAIGAFATLCGALGALPLGRFSHAVGELGVDIAGFVKAVRPQVKP